MKEGHKYENSDNLATSANFIDVKLGNVRITVHHTLKDRIPLTYWFSVFRHDTKYIDFDVREWWTAMGMPEPTNWTRISHRARLETVASLAESTYEGGFNIVDIAKANHLKMFPVAVEV